MKLPTENHSISAKIDAYHESQQGRPRPHMGCSLLGHPCDRWLWLNFRWAMPEQFSGRMLRLFRRGHNEEVTVIDDLKAIGVDVFDMKDGQHHVSFGSHVSGSVDGLIGGGVPGAEKTPHLLEIKTHSSKSFSWLTKNGVQKAKPQHHAQMQVYMHGTGMTRALYYAVCKDNDEIYTERVKYNQTEAETLIMRGQSIALSDVMPEKMPMASPEQFTCKYCPALGFCFKQETAPEVHEHCRTCQRSTPTQASTWICGLYDNADIPLDVQYKGCDKYQQHQDLLPF
jgi:hypothetical protein